MKIHIRFSAALPGLLGFCDGTLGRQIDSVYSGSWISDPRSMILEPGSRMLDSGSRILDPGSRILDPGSWILDPGSRILGPGSWIPPFVSCNCKSIESIPRRNCVCKNRIDRIVDSPVAWLAWLAGFLAGCLTGLLACLAA